MNIKLKQNDFIKTLKKKWLKKNSAILCMIICGVLSLYIIAKIIDSLLMIGFNTILSFCIYLYMRNKLMIFIEKEIYDNKE